MKLASFEAIVRALNDAQVRFIVVGGIAVNAHGHGRTTFDVDLVVQLTGENVLRAFQELETIEYRPLVPIGAANLANSEKRQEWKREKGMLVLQFYSDLHRQTRVDVFTEEPFEGEHRSHPSSGGVDSNERSSRPREGYRRRKASALDAGGTTPP